MDSVNASAKILDDTFYGQDSSNEAGAASCTPIEVRVQRANQIEKVMKRKEGNTS